jgi:hypothetical protein
MNALDQLKKKVREQIAKKKRKGKCCNLSFGLATKAKGL